MEGRTKSPRREIEDLKRRTTAILQLSGKELRKQFVQIAGKETPTQSYEKAFDLGCEHFDARIAREFAKACRFLAVIRRDYGEKEFEKVVEA